MEFFRTDDLRDGEICLRLTGTCDEDPVKQWVPAYYFDICLLDGTKVGKCDLRIGHNERLYIGGNIGYAVDEPHRGHHYAAKAVRLLLLLAARHQMEYLTISCVPSNLASAKTCQLAGGIYQETAAVPESHNMYAEGKRSVMIHRFDVRSL